MNIPTFEHLFKQIKINLWLAGIPFEESGITTRYYVFVGSLILMIIGEASFFVSKISSENFLVLVDLAPCLAIGINSFVKFVSLTFKRHKIRKLAETLQKLYNEILEDEKKIEIVKKPSIIVDKTIKYYFVLNALLICVYNFYTLVIIAYHYASTKEVIYPLPYPILTPFSTDTFLPWLVVYLLSISCGFIAVLFFTTVDALYCVLTSNVCSNFAILSDELISLDETNCHQLSHIVKCHQNILKLADDLEDVFSKPILANVLIGSLNICVLGFNLTAGDASRMLGFVLFLASVLLQILMMSVFGDNLIQESTKVSDAAFLCNWREMDESSKKNILIIINRSSKPKRLTAYKFSTIGYQSFTKIISTSWSYFTILKTVYKPPEQ